MPNRFCVLACCRKTPIYGVILIPAPLNFRFARGRSPMTEYLLRGMLEEKNINGHRLIKITSASIILWQEKSELIKCLRIPYSLPQVASNVEIEG